MRLIGVLALLILGWRKAIRTWFGKGGLEIMFLQSGFCWALKLHMGRQLIEVNFCRLIRIFHRMLFSMLVVVVWVGGGATLTNEPTTWRFMAPGETISTHVCAVTVSTIIITSQLYSSCLMSKLESRKYAFRARKRQIFFGTLVGTR